MSTPAAINPPFLADHVGSFMRPERLRAARQDYLAGKLDRAALKPIEDECIRDIVAFQESLGLSAVTDGEFRRSSWRDSFMDALEGFSAERKEADFAFRNAHGDANKARPVPEVVSPLKRVRGVATDEFAFLESITKATPKLTLPSPSALHFFRGDRTIRNGVYASVDAFFDDVARIYREEIVALRRLGCTYLQIDEVPLALLCDDDIRNTVKARGENADRLISDYIAAVNGALRERPAGMTICMHLCRGNAPGAWIGKGGYAPVAERLFNEVAVDGFFLEYDTERAGDFDPLRHMPADKSVVLGLVSTKTPQLETADGLKRRLDDAAKRVPAERLCLSPQCGFSSGFARSALTLDDARAKLQLILDVAAKYWPR
jgi:5-methyltetrahydropteroyltriglutamate--homocysteine methyltransferase